MSIEMERHALLWCAAIDYLFLAIWSILFVLPPMAIWSVGPTLSRDG